MRKASKAPGTSEFLAVFSALHAILAKHEPLMRVVSDKPGTYHLDAGYSEKWKRDVFFGGIRQNKRHVSFYLMPVYMHPELLKKVSPELKKRMQGKSCFNFSSVEPALFKELTALTKQGLERFKKAGLL
jgi:hypothetical protein